MDHQQKHWHWIVKNEVVVYHSFCSFALEYRPSLLKSLQIHHLKMKLHSYLFVFQVITHYVEPVIIEVQSFSHQQKRNVLRTTVKSAIDDAETFWRAFEENNYHNDLNSAITSFNIRQGVKSEQLGKALKTYADNSKRVNIVEGNFNTTVDSMRSYINRYIQQNNVKPTVVVDYLQIMPSNDPRMSDKQRTDYNVTELKRMSRDFNIPVMVISSLNRSNYLSPIDFESFKESGAIEYSADVIWGLQLEAIRDDLFNKEGKLKEKRELISQAKSEPIRQIELSCLKNRNGTPVFSCSFSYYAKYDYYEPNKINNYLLINDSKVKKDRL